VAETRWRAELRSADQVHQGRSGIRTSTAPIERLTLVRNEKNYKIFTPNSKTVRRSWTDPNPLPGENRYYLRIEQVDGNMGWTSPVWVNVQK
jgi:hypothetical protein